MAKTHIHKSRTADVTKTVLEKSNQVESAVPRSSAPSLTESSTPTNSSTTQYCTSLNTNIAKTTYRHSKEMPRELSEYEQTHDADSKNFGVADSKRKIGDSFRRYLSSNTKEEEKMYAVNSDGGRHQSPSAQMQGCPHTPSSSYPASKSFTRDRGGGGENDRTTGHCDQQHYQNNYEYQQKGGEGNTDTAELEESFNAMLMAWYHSGYATGRYQTLLEISKKDNRLPSQSQSQSQSQYQSQYHPQDPPDYPAREERSHHGNRQSY